MGRYRRIIHGLENLIVRVEVWKNKYSEKKAIKKKMPLYENVKWTDGEKKRFEDYWITYYGEPIADYWHKLYQSISGVFDEKYFPDYLYSTELEWRLNPKAYCDVLSDKNLLVSLFSHDDLCIPCTYVSCANGVFQDSDHAVITKEKAIAIASNVGKAVIKPTVESGSGHGVRVVTMENGIDVRTGDTLQNILNGFERNFVVQELITPCDEINTLSPNALSTFRVMTYITDHGIFAAPLSMRIGTGASDVDNIHSGGLVIGVNRDGTLKKYAYRLGYADRNDSLTAHPDSGIIFENYQIPMTSEILDMAIELHKRIPQLGIVSWDFSVNHKKQVTLIEINTRDQAVWFTQMVNGEAVFGDNTPYFLDVVKRK